jgi:2-succinyl-5-enolpyruvyl-6-hydroxy-3-cyclohexene-1-carboxylate synthase
MMNEAWAKEIIDQLVECGVTYFCVAPGSRSTPLTLAIAANPLITSIVHFDERGLAFHALGYAKGSGRPAALVVTSGTAVANLFPALMEASIDHIPLIVLTADRPPELRECGSNQSADQVKIFEGYVRYQVDLPCPDPLVPKGYLASTVAYATYSATSSRKGPVQLNCMFREPLLGPLGSQAPRILPTRYEKTQVRAAPSGVRSLAEKLQKIEKGVIIAASNSTLGLRALAQTLQWPILTDILAPERAAGTSSYALAYSDLIVKTHPHLKPDAIIHFGDRFVSKTQLQWIEASAPSLYLLAADHPDRHDPSYLVTHRIQCCPSIYAKQLCDEMEQRPLSAWMRQWQALSETIEENLTNFFEEEKELSEPALMHFLSFSHTRLRAQYRQQHAYSRCQHALFPTLAKR